jgi:hypothetical protein|uniref:Rossmann fold domain-containing protein n=1 Tax=Altererythrobacter segetis TaxID=1104773 RepID=UPI00140BE489|nr:hypothetical protein [Altererythrobacter segetis]
MGQAVLRIEGLPESALDAAARFHREWLDKAREALGTSEALALVFSAAAYDHRGWRLAAVQDLAREAAPKRVNGIAGRDEQAMATTIDWLAQAPGITGQLLVVD